MGRLDGQVAIVTGGAQGIGGAASRRLAEEGAKVLIADIDVSTAEANVETVRKAGGTAETFGADLGKHENIRAMIERAAHLWGRVDVLVNNAYSPVHGTGGGTALDVSEEEWDVGMGMLVKSIFLGAKYAVPEMQKTGAGSIVNISSVHGLLTAPGKLVYEAGKSAVIGVTRQMATDFGPMGIRVNAICPGHIATERILAAAQENPSGARFLADQYPLRKVGRPVDVANAIVFLSSEDASFITGHALVVDGGLTVQIQEDFGVRQAQYIRDYPDTRLPY